MATLRYVLLTAVRDRLLPALLLLIVAGLGVANFLADAAIAEGEALSLAYGATAVRLILVLGIVIFVAFHVRRLSDSRELEAMLARPISREGFTLAYFLGHAAIALLLAVCGTAALGLILRPSTDGLLLWGLSLAAEGLVMTALTLFAALSARSAVTAVMTALGFYALSRLISFFVDLAQGGLADILRGPAGEVLRLFLQFLHALLPRLDLFGQTQWLVHGWPSDGAPLVVVAQSLIAVALLLLAAIFDLRRRRF